MAVQLGTLVEDNDEKFAVVKIDQAKQIVILENQQSMEKVEMTFTYFSEMTGIKMDTRQVLHG